MIFACSPIVRSVAAALVLSCATAPAAAQSPEPRSSEPGTSGAELGDPIAKRKAANEEQARIAREQLAANAASQKAHDDAVAAAQLQKLRDDAAYAAALKEHAGIVRTYEDNRSRWETIVAACERGDKVVCVSRIKY